MYPHWSLTVAETTKNQGSKFDEDNYEKVDLSLIPWTILSRDWDTPHLLTSVALDVHRILNRDCDPEPEELMALFNAARVSVSLEKLAIALGYGTVKYDRNNWNKGFGGDWRRFLKATLRHLKAVLEGKEFDGQALLGYPKGNSHEGAVLFSNMVALQESTTKNTVAGIVEAVAGEVVDGFPEAIIRLEGSAEKGYRQIHETVRCVEPDRDGAGIMFIHGSVDDDGDEGC